MPWQRRQREVMHEAQKRKALAQRTIRIADDISTAVGNVQLLHASGVQIAL
jgi:hypothetical protein